MAKRVFVADAVVPIDSPPIAHGAVLVENGRVAVVGTREEILGRVPDAEEVRFDGVMLPGMVNAHTHLQFTVFAHIGEMVHDGFEAWSVAFDSEYAANSQSLDWHRSAVDGARSASQSGTTTIADVATDPAAVAALTSANLSGVVYIEALGNTWAQWIEEGREAYLERLDDAMSVQTERVTIGISPHAPYSLDTRVLADLVSIAATRRLRIHTHLAESAFEDEYCRFGTGPLADFVAGFGRDFQILLDGGAAHSTTEFARSVGLLGANSHVAHGIYVDEKQRSILREENTPVALCPRSNRVIGLQPPPVAAYLEEGNAFAVGTDSLSSSPSLDLLEDVRALRDIAIAQGYEGRDIATRLIRAATIGGAEALGLDGHVGAISPGSWADFAIFDVEPNLPGLAARIVADGAGSCTTTVVGGEILTRAPSQG